MDDADPNNTPTKKFLRNMGSRSYFKFIQPGLIEPEWPVFYEFEKKSGSTFSSFTQQDYLNLGFSEDEIISLAGFYFLKSVLNEETPLVWNDLTFSFDLNLSSTYRITPYYVAQQGSISAGSNDLIIVFVHPSEVLSVSRDPITNPGCNTFDNFIMEVEYDLEGFCGIFSNTRLESPGWMPPGWPQDWGVDVEYGDLYTFNIPIGSCDACLNAHAPYDAPLPVPCGCLTLNLGGTIIPCENAPAECEPTTWWTSVEVCCECDVRDLAPEN
ncbi:MAG: hypothetical protein H6606_09770 [Flavobacteriales bacterium]|nr:hypothetical protein [Flavobacteriales bacterium]